MKKNMQKLNIDDKTLIGFKSFVLEKHGKIRGVLHQEAEKALKEYMKIGAL
jgi:hypothetical protein